VQMKNLFFESAIQGKSQIGILISDPRPLV